MYCNTTYYVKTVANDVVMLHVKMMVCNVTINSRPAVTSKTVRPVHKKIG